MCQARIAGAITLAWILSVSTSSAAPSTQPYRPTTGPSQFITRDLAWHDAARNRDVPVRLYLPKDAPGPFPVILFSHGLGGSREGYAYLGQHWAAHGYVSVHLQHIGSDTAVWQGQANPMQSMRQAAANPRNAIDRANDVNFAIDQLEKLNRDDPEFKGRLDLKHIGMAGHSFGANTTLMAIGQTSMVLGKPVTLADPRISAAIAMSAPVPARRDQLDQTFGPIKVPCLHMTGTLDDSPIGNTPAADRRLPFDHMKLADQYLIIFNGGDHMIFSGRGPRRWRFRRQRSR